MQSKKGPMAAFNQSRSLTSFYKRPIDKSNSTNNVTPLDEIMKPRDHEIVSFNVGGVHFETYRSTLKNTRHTRLADDEFLQHFFLIEKQEYFFDRDPDIFKATLNFLRTGSLHLPSYVCGPAAKTELEFWGVPQRQIEQCCWINYNEWNSTQEALQRLEHDRKVSMLPHKLSRDRKATCWETWRPLIWRVMNRSNSSLAAKIFGIVSLLFVIVAIFSFLAETTEPFSYYTVTMTKVSNGTQRHLNSSQDSNVTGFREPILNASMDNYTETNTFTGDELAQLGSEVIIEKKVRTKHPSLQIIDIICLAYFILEYTARLIFSPKTLKHAMSLLAVIDLLAILPDLVEFIVYYARPDLKENVDAVGYITVIRVIRVLRIFRLVRHSAGLWILIYTLRASFSELMLLFWFMGLGILVFSSLIYYVEEREDFPSIPNGFWWALITMTTVGYGDMVPKTTLGRLVGSATAIAGVLMIGFTVPALVNNFMLYYRHVQFAKHSEELDKSHVHGEDATVVHENSRTTVKQGMKNGKLEHSPFISESAKL